MVEGLFLSDYDLRINSYNMLKHEITTSTSSMTSIPRPLKFIRTHFTEIKNFYEKFIPATEKDKTYKLMLSDLISVILTVVSEKDEEGNELTILSYVLSGTRKDITSWGIEYVRSLCSDIGQEYNIRLEKGEPINELIDLVKMFAPYLIKQHCESDAIDLLIEVESLDEIKNFINENNYKKVCLYLLSIANYSADTDEYRNILELVYNIYFDKFGQYIDAMRVAIKIGNILYIKQTFIKCKDLLTKMQLGFILAQEGIFLDEEDTKIKIDNKIIDIMRNYKLTEYFKVLAKTLELLEPKHPEDVFKSHLEDKKSQNTKKLESYKINMAYSIASSFINAGYGTEVLLSKKDSDWIYKNKEEGIQCLIAGMGLVNVWDYLEGPNKVYELAGNKEQDTFKRSGRNIGLGLSLCGIKEENDLAIAVLLEELLDKNINIKISALFGLGLAACGTQNDKLFDPIREALQDFSYGFEVSAFASLTLGLIFIGSSNEDVFNDLFSILLSRNENAKGKLFENPFFVIYILGIGLLCLGKQTNNDFMIETLVTIEEFSKEMRDYMKTMLISFSYAGSGNVSKVQELMQIIAKSNEEINPKVQSIAVIGCSLIAIGEEVGTEMLSRSFNHFLQFGDINIKKTVSLAIALLNLSNPKVQVIDSLTKFCYDTDKTVSMNAIYSMGLVSSGSNHSRVGGLLRSLAAYYAEDSNPLFMVRIAQGLLHLGKGLISLDPIYSHKLLINNRALAGILITLFSFTETENLICGKHQFLLYSLALAMKPKLVITVDKNLKPVDDVQLMVGQAVDIVGQTGNPRTISGFQIHNSPAVINTGERCEINGEDIKTYSDVLEGVIIIEDNRKREEK
jgi:26S proteasome regulatory subunit N1